MRQASGRAPADRRERTETEKRFGRASTYALAAMIFAIMPAILVWSVYHADPATVTAWDMAGASAILPLANAFFLAIWWPAAKRDFEPPREGSE